MIILRRAEMSEEDIARFWEKVDKSSDCWTWKASTDRFGYGQIWFNHKLVYAHRFSYALAYGECANNLVIDHKCHNTGCVNPSHLHLVTQQQNNENMVTRKDSKSGIRGVSWNIRAHKWLVRAQVKGERYFGGYYSDIHEAEKSAIALRNSLMTNNILDSATGNTASFKPGRSKRKGHDR